MGDVKEERAKKEKKEKKKAKKEKARASKKAKSAGEAEDGDVEMGSEKKTKPKASPTKQLTLNKFFKKSPLSKKMDIEAVNVKESPKVEVLATAVDIENKENVEVTEKKEAEEEA